MNVDVLLSVWNHFFSKEQIEGFRRAELLVHWHGNRRTPTIVKKSSYSVLSWALLRAHFVTGSEMLKHASMECFDLSSSTIKIDSKLVWAYVESNNRLIRKARAQGIPVVLDVPIGHQRQYQELLTHEYKKEGLKAPSYLWERWSQKCEDAYAQANYISVGSNFVKNTLVQKGVDSRKIIVNPYGVDAAKWKDSFNLRKTREKTDKCIFIYTASIGLRKGIHYLLRAWKKAELRNAELWIVGSGILDLDALCGRLPSNVHMLGYLSHDEIVNRYAQADVFVLPSLFEGLVRSGLEAMAAGLPVIITYETGLTDFVENGKQGWMVRSADVDALVEQLRYCHSYPDRVALAGTAAHDSMQNMTFDSYGDRCAAIAKAVIAGDNPLDQLYNTPIKDNEEQH